MAIAALVALSHYELTPGAVGQAPGHWPEASKLKRGSDRPTLLLFAHPLCPCSRASIHELGNLVQRCGDKVDVRVIFYCPSQADDEWTHSTLCEVATDIPKIQVIWDPNGVEAELFSATTSGHAMLYDQAGRLQFSGGITASRGHEGANIGRDSIIEFITVGSPIVATTPVYGCPITNSN